MYSRKHDWSGVTSRVLFLRFCWLKLSSATLDFQKWNRKNLENKLKNKIYIFGPPLSLSPSLSLSLSFFLSLSR
jgi:hypothetical protein